MTNTELIQAIRNEIERLKSIEYPCDNSQQETGFFNALDRMTDFLSTLEEKSEIPNDLEKAAEISFDEAYALTGDYMGFLAKGLTENQPRPIGPHWFCEYAKNRFVAGAKWQKGQMMKGAVEGEIVATAIGHLRIVAEANEKSGVKDGDKVRVIVLPKEETSTSQSKYLEKSDYDFIKNCFENKQCYNCGLRKECEQKNPDSYEPIGTCSKWTKE